MSDRSRLESRLAKLRRPERIDGGARTLRGDGPQRLLSEILTEIDETILPRRLTFVADTGWQLHLDAANRRLVAVADPAPEGIAAGPVPTEPDEPRLAALRSAIEAGLANARSVSVRSARPEGAAHPSDVGLPASVLGQRWAVYSDASEEEAAPGARLERFLASLDGIALAWLRIEGETVVEEAGDEDDAEALGAHAALILDGYLAKRATLFAGGRLPHLVVLAPREAGLPVALFVDHGDASAFVLLDASGAAEAAMRWRAAVLGQ